MYVNQFIYAMIDNKYTVMDNIQINSVTYNNAVSNKLNRTK